MKHLLSELHLDDILRPLAGESVLIAFDFDGTLAPIVDDPDQAQMRTETRRLLQQIAQAYPCAVISSRRQSDLIRAVAGAAVWEVIGNHGLEPAESRARHESQISAWVPVVREQLSSYEGVVVEDKGQTLTIHYRRAADKDRVIAAIQASAQALPEARVISGHEVVHVLPREAPGKGMVLGRLIDRRKSDAVLYVGDDESDEDVFALDRPGLLTVRVRKVEGSRAQYYLRDQDEIDALMQRLLDLRQPAPVRGRSRPPPHRAGSRRYHQLMAGK